MTLGRWQDSWNSLSQENKNNQLQMQGSSRKRRRRKRREPIPGPLLCEKALEINKKLGGPEDLKGTTG